MNRRNQTILTAALLAVGGVGLIAVAQNEPDAPAMTAPAETPTVTGTVIGLNLNGDGEPNGLLVKTGDGPLTQLNFPPHLAGEISKAIKTGTQVTAKTRPLGPPPPRSGEANHNGSHQPGPVDEHHDPDHPKPPQGDHHDANHPAPPPADHPVFELTSVTPEGGTEVKVTPPEELPTQHVDGKVARLNYNREGHVDGAVLDDGTLIHVGPKEAESLKLAVGQQLSVDGTKPPKAGDNKVLHATKVNDTVIERPKLPAKGKPKAGM